MFVTIFTKSFMLELFPPSSVSELEGINVEILGPKLKTNFNQFSSLPCKIVTIEPSILLA